MLVCTYCQDLILGLWVRQYDWISCVPLVMGIVSFICAGLVLTLHKHMLLFDWLKFVFLWGRERFSGPPFSWVWQSVHGSLLCAMHWLFDIRVCKFGLGVSRISLNLLLSWFWCLLDFLSICPLSFVFAYLAWRTSFVDCHFSFLVYVHFMY